MESTRSKTYDLFYGSILIAPKIDTKFHWSGESYDILSDFTTVIRHYDGWHLTYWRVVTDSYIVDTIPRYGLEDKKHRVIRIRRRKVS